MPLLYLQRTALHLGGIPSPRLDPALHQRGWGLGPRVGVASGSSTSYHTVHLISVDQMYPRIRNAGSSASLLVSYANGCRRHDSTVVFKQLEVGTRCGKNVPTTWIARGRNACTCSKPYWTLLKTSYTKLSLAGAFNSPYVRRLFTNTTTRLGSVVSGDTSEPLAGLTTDDDGKGKFDLVYKGPLRSAVRAVKIFSLSTCIIAVVGGPILVMLGNPTVPLIGRILMTSFVLTVGVSTTLILHWLMKGYIIDMHFDPKSERLQVYTLTMLAGRRCHTFHLSEAGPPDSLTAFSTFQAMGKSYFMHTEVMEDKALLGKILGPYMALEDSEFWKEDKKMSNTNDNDTDIKSS